MYHGFMTTAIIIKKIPWKCTVWIRGRVFKLGQPIRVRVADASKEERTIDFEYPLYLAYDSED